jgi:hypothetical protein
MVQNLCIVFVNEIPTKLPDYTKLDQSLLTGASGKGVINLKSFTNKTLVKEKTAIITKQKYEELIDIYQSKPYLNLVMFDIYNKNYYLDKDKKQLCCIILFISSVYCYHYICYIDKFEETKKDIKKLIITKNMVIQKYSAIKITFNEDGTFNNYIDEPLY